MDGTKNDTADKRAGLRGLLPDLTPLRVSRDFRLVWSSGLVTSIGSVFTLIALQLQVAQITGSALAVGALGAAELIPVVLFGLYGGAIADAFDRRKVILATELGLSLVALGLLGNALLGQPMIWPLYVAAAATAALQGVQQPSLEAVTPRIVAHDQLPAAISVTAARWTVAGVVGPAIAGVAIASFGVRTAFAVDAVSFAISIALLLLVRPVPASPEAESPSFSGVGRAIGYAWSRPELVGTYAADMAATVLALPIALFPFLATELHALWALGLLYSAMFAGSLVAGLTSGWTGRVHRHGRMILLGAVICGAAVTIAGLVPNIWVLIVMLAISGAATWVSDVFRGIIWSQSIPDGMRGRLAGIELITGSAGPAIGDLRAGALATRFGIRPALWIGGLATLITAGTLSAALPSLWRYDARTDPHVAQVKAAVEKQAAE
ncbi:MFS transporter [Fodinicola feengrottensis]|uniref:MFS transporter n=1 Tax=Fodinicola feengrottensis TaxID=435914 RepID=A0ABN2IXH3_9ACTN|nr:MFS transporter [Fodinicola feengrottensis]